VTIGVAAHGAAAGAAVLAALAAVEAVGVGEIRGFAVFAAIEADGRLLRAETQRGGHAALLAELDAGGLRARATASTVAAVISSGPDRPEPLAQFLPGSAAGLVTGHRLPNTAGADGVPVNQAALRLLEAGAAPEEAVTRVIAANPEIDAGLIAVSLDGVAAAETGRVLRRTERGAARLSLRGGAAAVAVLHNAIEPWEGLAALAAGAARAVLEAALPPLPCARLLVGLVLEPGVADALWLDAEGAATRIVSANPGHRTYRGWTSSAVYLGTPVWRDGVRLGIVVGEARCRLEQGRIVEVDPTRPAVAWLPDPE